MIGIDSLTEQFFDSAYARASAHSCMRDNKSWFSYSHFMIIPISETAEEVEIPAFLYQRYTRKVLGCPPKDVRGRTLIATLIPDAYSPYRSLPRVLEDVFQHQHYRADSLVEIKPKGLSEACYGCYGALFDEHFNPIMLSTFTFPTYYSEERGGVDPKPKFRISPSVFSTRNKNNLQKYIINKIFPAAVAHASNEDSPFQILIEKIPYKVIKPDDPDIIVQNKDLINSALNYYKEMAWE